MEAAREDAASIAESTTPLLNIERDLSVAGSAVCLNDLFDSSILNVFRVRRSEWLLFQQRRQRQVSVSFSISQLCVSI